MRIGIDVGGTNTDAVALDGRAVLAWAKRPTTPDVTTGILQALQAVLQQLQASPEDIHAVMIGTTHFTNAVVQRQALDRIAVIRLGAPATTAIPPLEDWPDDLRAVVAALVEILPGGHQFDGTEIAPLDPHAVTALVTALQTHGVRSIAISSVFSPAVPDHERTVAQWLRDALPDVAITLSHEIGRIGLLERENAAALNACLVSLAQRTIAGFQQALERLGIRAPLYLSQNDGTLMTAEFAARYPVLTFASGPTNSMRGAAFLSGVHDAIVLDVGGTTTDAGVLVRGFPREASFAVEIGGVRTNFRMPDVLSIGLGGGSIVHLEQLTVGPQSVGYRLVECARIFGGTCVTASDIAVAAGRASFGDPARVRDLDPAIVQRLVERIDQQFAELVDRMKLKPDPLPVIVVGGGSVLVPDSLPGASTIVRPPHAAFANAIGAAIAQVSGEVDRVFSLEGRTRDAVLAEARQEAINAAYAAGAARETIEIVEFEEIPLAYLPSNAVRIRVKAVGDLRGAA